MTDRSIEISRLLQYVRQSNGGGRLLPISGISSGTDVLGAPYGLQQ